MKQADFIANYGPISQDVGAATGLDPALVLGQIAQETGWGDHIKGNNIFGISPGGTVAQYPDVPTAAKAYVDLIGKRYPQLAKAGDLVGQAKALGASDYNPAHHNYGASVANNAFAMRQAGFGVPSADDLSKMVEGDLTAPQQAPKSAEGPSADDLSKLVDGDFPAKPVATKADMIPQGSSTPPPSVAPDVPRPSIGEAVSAVGRAAGESYSDALMPSEPNWLDRNVPAAGTLVRGANGLLVAAPAALFRGGQETVAQLGALAGQPRLGRDFAAMPEAFAPSRANMVGAAEGATSVVRGVDRLAGMAENAIDRRGGLALLKFRLRNEPIAPGTSEAPIETPPSAPVPAESVAGAQKTPIWQTYQNMTPDEAAAARKTNENKQLTQMAHERMENGVDRNEYIPGVTIREAVANPSGRVADASGQVAEGQPLNAVLEKSASETDPAFQKQIQAMDRANNEARIDHFTGMAQDANAIQRAEALREEATTQARDAAFAQKSPVDAQPVVDVIDSTLASSAGKRTAVADALKGVRKSLFDKDGKLETDPEIIYGARQNVTDMLSRTGLQSNPATGLARRELVSVKDALDGVIETGAVGYKDYLAKYNELSKPIDVMETLQHYLTGSGKITDSQGVMQYGKVQTMMEHLVNDRAKTAIDPAKSIPDDMMEQLFALRNDLARQSYKDQIAKTKGSDTVQKLNAAAQASPGSPIGSAVKHGVEAAAHALAFTYGGPLTNMLVHGSKGYMVAKAARKAARAAQAELDRSNSVKQNLLKTR